METAPRTAIEQYTAVPMAGLVGANAVPFPLYLRTADDVWVLYRPAHSRIDESHIGRLVAEGVLFLYIRAQDQRAYCERVEAELDAVLLDRAVPLADRANVLYGISGVVAEQLLESEPGRPELRRAQKVMMSASSLLLREGQGFHALRRLLTSDSSLVRHSLTVGFLSMGLSRVMFGGDAASIAVGGLAGLLHDIGHIGYEDLEHDPEHTLRGAALLQKHGLPVPVVEVARSHHECFDGSGYPDGLAGEQIPALARLVGLVTLFDRVYSRQNPRVGVFDALRIVAQAYRGCFDERMAQGLVKLFR